MISIGFESPNILAAVVNCKGNDFESCITILKNQKFTWNPEKKVWMKNAVLYNENLYDTLRIVTEVYFPDPVKEQIINYSKNLPSELIISQPVQSIDYSTIIKEPYKPIKGKEPFENFQDEDIRRSLSQNRFMFNWEMGCGKSFATAVIYEYLRVHNNVNKMILLTSRIGTYNLKGELSKFCKHLTEDDVQVFNSPKSFKESTRLIFDSEKVCDKSVLIFSYDSWKLMSSAYGDKPRSKKTNIPLEKFFGESQKLICLDECHYLSNPKSIRSQAVFKYLKYFKYRYLFSATPADKPEKLYSILVMLDPKLCRYLKYTDWINKYNDVGTWFSSFAINKKGWHEKELNELNNELAFYSVKRKSKDVLNLPPYHVNTIEVDMSDKQKNLYKVITNEIVNNCVKKNPDMSGASVDIIREAFSIVTSFVENPNILATSSTEDISDAMKEKCAKYNYGSDYAKLDVIDAILEDEYENEQRGIIWYIHPKTKDVILERYAKYRPVVISADLTEDQRDAELKKFKSNPSHKLLIASQNILATSVTLTECTFAVYLETSFSFETYYQSTGRIYRIGQEQPVRVYHIWLRDSTDMFHVNAIEQKSDLVNLLFSAKRPTLSMSQLKDLFTGKL